MCKGESCKQEAKATSLFHTAFRHLPAGFFGTSLPTNWTSEEVQLYDPLFADLDSTIKAEGGGLGTDGVDPVAFLQSEYLAQCGLPRKALREIWQVANPHLKSSLSICWIVQHFATF